MVKLCFGTALKFSKRLISPPHKRHTILPMRSSMVNGGSFGIKSHLQEENHIKFGILTEILRNLNGLWIPKPDFSSYCFGCVDYQSSPLSWLKNDGIYKQSRNAIYHDRDRIKVCIDFRASTGHALATFSVICTRMNFCGLRRYLRHNFSCPWS